MTYTFYELLWLFFAYSFAGWILETVAAAVKKRTFVNRGLVNGPLCVTYGAAAVAMTLSCHELSGFWLLAGIVILATLTQWIAGHVLEWLYHEKWWDYSGLPWNLDGYICVPASAVWGVLGVLAFRWGNPLLTRLFALLPGSLGKILLWILLLALAADMLATVLILTGKTRRIEKWQSVDSLFASLSVRLDLKLSSLVNRRLERAYPRERTAEEEKELKTASAEGFAAGCSFYKIILLFVIGCVLGDLTETVFCRITAGVWMSRSSLVWGPFSIVWGLAIALVTVLLYRYKDCSDRFLFLTGTVLGGAYEYLCSVFTEMMFGTVFWDYSKIPFNLGGRINLLYCFFWGIAAVVWFKGLYPVFSRWIEKIPTKAGKPLVWLLIVFMTVNMAVSFMALWRSDERSRGVAAEASWQQVMDERFGDERLARIYPNAIKVE